MFEQNIKLVVRFSHTVSICCFAVKLICHQEERDSILTNSYIAVKSVPKTADVIK